MRLFCTIRSYVFWQCSKKGCMQLHPQADWTLQLHIKRMRQQPPDSTTPMLQDLAQRQSRSLIMQYMLFVIIRCKVAPSWTSPVPTPHQRTHTHTPLFSIYGQASTRCSWSSRTLCCLSLQCDTPALHLLMLHTLKKKHRKRCTSTVTPSMYESVGRATAAASRLKPTHWKCSHL